MESVPVLTASWPMYRWQKPPIFPSAYASAHRSSNRRCNSIERRSSRSRSGFDFPLPDVAVCVAPTVDSFFFFVAMKSTTRCVGYPLPSLGIRYWLNAGGLHLLPRVIARPHQRSGFDVTETHRHSFVAQHAELVRRDVAVKLDV